MNYPTTTKNTIAAFLAGTVSGAVASLVVTAISVTSLVIGGGTPIIKHGSATSTVNPASIAAGACTSTDITATGAVAGNNVDLVLPTAWSATSVSFTGFAKTDAVTVTMCNVQGSAAIDLPSGTMGAGYWGH